MDERYSCCEKPVASGLAGLERRWLRRVRYPTSRLYLSRVLYTMGQMDALRH